MIAGKVRRDPGGRLNNNIIYIYNIKRARIIYTTVEYYTEYA